MHVLSRPCAELVALFFLQFLCAVCSNTPNYEEKPSANNTRRVHFAHVSSLFCIKSSVAVFLPDLSFPIRHGFLFSCLIFFLKKRAKLGGMLLLAGLWNPTLQYIFVIDSKTAADSASLFRFFKVGLLLIKALGLS